MRDIIWYIEEARRVSNIDSDNKLSIRLGLSQPTVSQMRRGFHLPAEATMLKLADLAGISPDVALLDLNQWRTKDPTSRAVYERIASIIAKTAAALALAFIVTGTQPAQADTNRPTTVYYGKLLRRLFRHFSAPAAFA